MSTVEDKPVVRPVDQRISWKEKKQVLSKLYGRGGLVVVCETGVVVHEASPNADKWQIEDYGIPAIISNMEELVICIADLDSAEPHREYSITPECDYRVRKSYFHTFICEDEEGGDLLVGLSFANSEVAKRVAQAVDQLTPGKLHKFEDRGLLKKVEISQPKEFKHVAHIGGGSLPTESAVGIMEARKSSGSSDMELEEPPAKTDTLPQGSLVGKQIPTPKDDVRKPSPPQAAGGGVVRSFSPQGLLKKMVAGAPSKKSLKVSKRVLHISAPLEFQHVAHMGNNCFALKNEDGVEDPFQMSGEFARKRSATPSSSSDPLMSSGEEPEVKKTCPAPMSISSPHDFQHVSHISKDTAISAFMLTGNKDPFSIITAIANSALPPDPPWEQNIPDPPPVPPVLPPVSRQTQQQQETHLKITFPPPPPKLDHTEFLREISAFNPSLLRHVSVLAPREQEADPNSLQQILKASFENMRGKLASVWRQSIVTTFGDHMDGDDEFDYPGVYVPRDAREQFVCT